IAVHNNRDMRRQPRRIDRDGERVVWVPGRQRLEQRLHCCSSQQLLSTKYLTDENPAFYHRCMASVEPIRKNPQAPLPLEAHAIDNLRFIRETMERAGSFTAVPGWGGVGMGATALAAAGLASHAPERWWLWFWMIEGAVAVAIGFLAMYRKA